MQLSDKKSAIWVIALILIALIIVGIFISMRRKKKTMYGGAVERLASSKRHRKPSKLEEGHDLEEGEMRSHLHDITSCMVDK